MSIPPPSAAPSSECLVVGVDPGQGDELLHAAGGVARRYGARLLLATVDPGRYPVNAADGSTWSEPLDPDSDEPSESVFDPDLRRRIGTIMNDLEVEWTTHCLVGDTAAALAALAEERDAAMTVVGTREPSFGSGVREVLGGSVAVHLAHRQGRPVLVIPLHPVAKEARLPWEAS